MARLNNEVERSHDSPMDYSWNDGCGPVDSTSPFVQNSHSQGNSTSQKRSSNELDSPTKPDVPKLRNPEGQRFLFNTMPAAKSNWDAYRQNSAFTTPRKLGPEIDDTSGAEQSSPAYADSEATPDPPRASSPTKAQGAIVKFEGNGNDQRPDMLAHNKRSGKGGIFKRSGYSDLLQRKVDKRRRRVTDKDVQNAPRRFSNGSDDEERPSSNDGPPQPSQRQRAKSPQKMGLIPSILTFIDAHPSLPNTLSYYVQFILNCVFAGALVLVLYGVFSTIRHDIEERAMMESSDILAEMASCAREFKENRCERDLRVPAMEMACNGWEKCMARDPYKVGRSKLSAGMFAEIFNSFIEPISTKALLVTLTVIIGCFAINNVTFGMYRSKHNSPPPPAPSQPLYMGHPNQPQLGFASPGYGQFQTPYQQHLGGMPPPTAWHQDGSPAKRLEYQ